MLPQKTIELLGLDTMREGQLRTLTAMIAQGFPTTDSDWEEHGVYDDEEKAMWEQIFVQIRSRSASSRSELQAQKEEIAAKRKAIAIRSSATEINRNVSVDYVPFRDGVIPERVFKAEKMVYQLDITKWSENSRVLSQILQRPDLIQSGRLMFFFDNLGLLEESERDEKIQESIDRLRDLLNKTHPQLGYQANIHTAADCPKNLAGLLQHSTGTAS